MRSALETLSYFNPFSSRHHALKHFGELSRGEKILTGLATAVVTVLTCPVAGVGGVAVFRALTNKYAHIDPKEDSDSSETKTAKKVHTQQHRMSSVEIPYQRFETLPAKNAEAYIRSEHPDLNKKGYYGDNLIHIACGRQDFDGVIKAMLEEESADFDIKNAEGRLPIQIYDDTHARRGDGNNEIRMGMMLKMKDTDYLEYIIFLNDDPALLKKALQRLSELDKPYTPQGNIDSKELILLLLTRSQTEEDVRNILDYYQLPPSNPMDDDNRMQMKISPLYHTLQVCHFLTLEEKNATVEKLNLLLPEDKKLNLIQQY